MPTEIKRCNTYACQAGGSLQNINAYRRNALPINGPIPANAVPDVSVAYDYDSLGRLHTAIEPHTPTIARMMPREIKHWNGFSATNASQSEAKIAYV
jgi:hypothetical protein